jgi:hypothetical protein
MRSASASRPSAPSTTTIVGIGSARDQFGDRLGTRYAKAQHHDVTRQGILDLRHAPPLPAALDDEVVGRAHEDEDHRQADRRDDHRFDQSCPIADRRNVAEPGRGDGNHGEIDHVEETDVPVVVVGQPFAVDPVDQHHQRQQREGGR